MMCRAVRSSWALGMTVAVLLVGSVACEVTDSNDKESLPVISPSSVKVSVTTTNKLVFTAKGGTPAYVWEVSNPALGSLVDAGTTAIYTGLPVSGQNFVTVTDSKSNAVTATITQL